MNEPIVVAPGVLVPAEALRVAAVRAAGPGGQNVNKVSSKVQVHVDLGKVTGLSDGARQRLRKLAGRRIDAEGQLVISSQRTRDQLKNLADARDRIRDLLAAALVEPVQRRPTRPTKGAVRRRLQDKRMHSQKKQQRRMTGD